MICAFRRHVAKDMPGHIDMIGEPDGDWDALKALMCAAWDVEALFDERRIWEVLRRGGTVLVGYEMFCVYDDDLHNMNSTATPFELFAGDVAIFDGVND